MHLLLLGIIQWLRKGLTFEEMFFEENNFENTKLIYQKLMKMEWNGKTKLHSIDNRLVN